MYRFRLASPIAGVPPDPDANSGACLIPTGAEVTTSDPAALTSSVNRLKLIQVEWDGRTFSVFLMDLLARGERVEYAGG